MIYALFAGVGENAKQAMKISDPAMRSAYDTGTGIGVTLLLFVWAAASVVFGLPAYFTRARREPIEVESKR